jgi:DNA-binding response OmpR family regulator
VSQGAVRSVLARKDQTQQELIQQQLDEAGYEVHVADDGESGLQVTKALLPDVVICDWVMPRLDGIEYCRRVKADPQLRSTYVAMLTAREDCTDKVKALDAGADDFLVKPLDHQELLARVRAGIRIRQLQRELLEARHRSALLEMATTLGLRFASPR